MADLLAKRRAKPVKKPGGPAVLIIEPRGVVKKKSAQRKKPARVAKKKAPKKKTRAPRRGK
jgi:hypothetical protein